MPLLSFLKQGLSLLPVLALLIALPARADDTATLQQLRNTQIAVYAMVRDFHMQTLMAGDPARTAQLGKLLGESGETLDGIAIDSGNAAQKEAITAARKAFSDFARTARANNIVADGYTDDILVGDLYVGAEALSKALQGAIEATPGGGKQREVTDRAHATNLLMQRAAAAYLKRSAQMSPDIGAAIPYDLGEASAELDKKMTALAKELQANASARNTMRNVMTKWNFIKGSLINYNDKAVPFIVDRYAGQIMAGLQQVVSDLSN